MKIEICFVYQSYRFLTKFQISYRFLKKKRAVVRNTRTMISISNPGYDQQ